MNPVLAPLVLTGELPVSGGYATKAGARRALRTADKAYYAGVDLEVRERVSAEWQRIGIDKPEFYLVAVPKN